MKLMIASDIHGSAYYCDLLIERFKQEKADKILLLGDILYHGPRNDLPKDYAPKKVIEMLNNIANKLLCVRGNCDCDVDQMVLKFPIMAEYAVIMEGNKLIYATHGHKAEELRELLKNTGNILLHGHTHVPVLVQEEGYIYINPGSVSIPKENSKNSYIILEDGQILWKNILDIDDVWKKEFL